MPPFYCYFLIILFILCIIYYYYTIFLARCLSFTADEHTTYSRVQSRMKGGAEEACVHRRASVGTDTESAAQQERHAHTLHTPILPPLSSVSRFVLLDVCFCALFDSQGYTHASHPPPFVFLFFPPSFSLDRWEYLAVSSSACFLCITVHTLRLLPLTLSFSCAQETQKKKRCACVSHSHAPSPLPCSDQHTQTHCRIHTLREQIQQ